MSSHYNDNEEMDEQMNMSSGPNWKKAFGVILAVVLAVVVAGGAAIYFLGHNLINMANFVADSDVEVVEKEELPSEAVETVSTELANGKVVNDEELNNIHKSMSDAAEIERVNDEDVFNFLLVGVDRRDKTWNGNSDSMMLVSINYDDKRVIVISLMRDTYVDIPDVGYAKLNNAYARGGGPLLTETISNSYQVELEKYAAVDFENMIKIVDACGGVELTMTEQEITVANGYMMDMCNTLGMDGNDYILPLEDGTYQCNGVQAVAYARNRYVGNSDYARTERQRYVISQIIQKVKNMSVTQLTAFATKCLPLVTHNFEESEIWSLVKTAPEILEFSFVQDRIPYDGLYEVVYVDGQDMLVPEWEATVDQLHRTIYEDGKVSSNSDNKQDEDRIEGHNQYSADFRARLAEEGLVDNSAPDADEDSDSDEAADDGTYEENADY